MKESPGVETQFVKGPVDEDILVFYNKQDGMYIEQTNKYKKSQENVKAAIDECLNLSNDKLSECVSFAVKGEIDGLIKKNIELVRTRDLIADRLRNYTCDDDNVTTSTPISTSIVNVQNKQYTVNSYLDLPSAKIWTVPNFITKEECKILMDKGRPLLRRATVAADDGSSIVSENRKAQQAAYEFSRNKQRDPLW